MANVNTYTNTAELDTKVRKFTSAANQIGKVPTAAFNDRFMYSPKTLTINDKIYGLIDKTATIPYEYDPVALYSALRDYQKFPQIGYKYFPDVGTVPGQPWEGESGEEATACDFRILYSNVPPPNNKVFMNGVRGIDLDNHISSMIDYADGGVNSVNPSWLWTPFWNGYTHSKSNTWHYTDNSNVEYGVVCGPTHYLKTVAYSMNATENASLISYVLSSSPGNTVHVPATFDDLWTLKDLFPVSSYSDSNFDWKDFTAKPIEPSIWEIGAVPKCPEEDGIIEFRADFELTRYGSGSSQSTTLNVSFDLPLQVAFSNLTPYPIQIIIYCHPYNWWFRQNRSGSYSVAVDCKNSFTGTTWELNEAKAWAAARNPENTFYDFGTGLQYISDGRPGFNTFYLHPFETKNLIDIDVSNIWRQDNFSSQNFHGMRNGYIRTDAGVETVSNNPLNGGTYGFWIDLNEAFFKIVDEIPGESEG